MFSRKNTGDGTTEPGACDGAVQAIDAKDKVISEQRFDSIWDAIEATPAKAANMKARAELMMAIQASVTGWKLTQAGAAKRLAVTQPRLNDLLKGRINKFSLDALLNLASQAGLAVRVEVRDAAA